MSDKQKLLLLGTSLYLCEGTKLRTDNRGWKHYDLEFTNKDPRTIRIFLRFLREVIEAEENRIKIQIFLYPDHSEEELLSYWSKICSIPRSRFHKVIRLKQKNVKYIPNPLGVAKIRYSHKEHFLEVDKLINEIFGEVA